MKTFVAVQTKNQDKNANYWAGTENHNELSFLITIIKIIAYQHKIRITLNASPIKTSSAK